MWYYQFNVNNVGTYFPKSKVCQFIYLAIALAYPDKGTVTVLRYAVACVAMHL